MKFPAALMLTGLVATGCDPAAAPAPRAPAQPAHDPLDDQRPQEPALPAATAAECHDFAVHVPTIFAAVSAKYLASMPADAQARWDAALAPQLPSLIALSESHCTQDHWSQAAATCNAAVTTVDELDKCNLLLTKAQDDDLEQGTMPLLKPAIDAVNHSNATTP